MQTQPNPPHTSGAPSGAIELQANGLTVRLSFSLQPFACSRLSEPGSAAYDAPVPPAHLLVELEALCQSALPTLRAAFHEAESVLLRSYIARGLKQLSVPPAIVAEGGAA